jgi:hypothetical protein
MPRRSPVWLLVCALALATGLTLLAMGSLLFEPAGSGRLLPDEATALPSEQTAEPSPSDPHTSLRQPLMRAVVDLPSPSPLILRLVRLTFAPGAWLPAVTFPGPVLFAAEAGTLSLWADGPAGVSRVTAGLPLASPEAITPMLDLAVRPGEQVLRLAGTKFGLRNDARTPAVVLGVAVFPAGTGPMTPMGWALFRPPPSMPADAVVVPGGGFVPEYPAADSARVTEPTPQGWPADVTVQPLASVAVSVRSGTATLTVDRWTIAPGAGIPSLDALSGLLVVEAGVLGLPPDRSETRPTVAAARTAGVGTPSGTEALAPVGEAVVVQPGTGDAGRNAGEGPLVVLALTIGPDDP